jgi:hypothetical protein
LDVSDSLATLREIFPAAEPPDDTARLASSRRAV